MFEDFISALQNFASHKLRTSLSLLGIVIGIMTVVVITSLGSSMYGSLLNMLKKNLEMPINAIDVYPNWNNKTKAMSFIPDEKYRHGLYKATNKISYIFYTNEFPVFVLKGSAELAKDMQNQSLLGVERNYLEQTAVELEYGNYFSLGDYADRSQKAILGYNLAINLFPEGNAVGKKFSITIPNTRYSNFSPAKPLIFYMEVKGVVKQKTESYNNIDTSIYVPRTFVTALNNNTKAGYAKVFLKNENDYKEVKDIVIQYSNDFSGSTDSAYVFGAKEFKNNIDQFLTITQIILSAIAFVSLFVGGINIMNIMTATVAERKKEIGIRKAIGATNLQIIVQFLIEATTICLVAGVIGVLFGFGISYGIITLLPANIFSGDAPIQMQFIINTQGAFIAFTVSICVGILFGLVPAIKASKLDPILALS